MDGLLRPISMTSITTHFEIACPGVVVSCTIVGASLLYVPLSLSGNAFNVFPLVGFVLIY